jgi:RNA polymerase sigma-70 factor (ECF subfamily)
VTAARPSSDWPPSRPECLHPSEPPGRTKGGAGALHPPLVGIFALHGTSEDPADRTSQADEQLLRAAAADPSALGDLYDRYAKLVYGLAVAILGNREEAQDLTQEVFLAVSTPTAYDSARGSVSAFLTTMTRSRAIDRLRRRGRSVRLLKTWHEATPPAPAPTSPFERLSMAQCAERVRGALAELPDAERQVLELAYYKGLSQAEIAADLDTPLGTVKSRSRRGLMTLKRSLEDLTG